MNTNSLEERCKSLWQGPETVADFIALLSSFPADWPVHVVTPAGGGIGIEHRQRKGGGDFVAIFGKNGGRIGEHPLTEEEYEERSEEFLHGLRTGKRYTSIHGDHRLYYPHGGCNDTCYGIHYDRRIIERMVAEGKIPADSVDIERVQSCES